MEHIIFYLKIVFGAIGGAITFLFGGADIALYVLLAFLVIDYITGVINAILKKKLSSEVGGHGIAKKIMILVVLIVAALLDRLLGNEAWMFRTIVCYFYIANEGISILENAGEIGIPVPQKILTALAQLSDAGNDDKKDE